MRPRKTVLFSYQLLTNVGCEIIIRGSIAFLTRAFPNHDLHFVLSSYDVARDVKILADIPNVRVVPVIEWKRYIRALLAIMRLDVICWVPRFHSHHFREADLFVSVGGDIYTMWNNGLPRDWLGYEHFANRHGIPSIMFGANMEKFEALNAKDLKTLVTHLERFRVIAVRDKQTEIYLAKYGLIENTVFFPDPIFLLRPTCTYRQRRVETIALNLSPILLQEFGEMIFTHLGAIVSKLVERGYQLTLLPHTYTSDQNPELDDRIPLQKLYDHLPSDVASAVRLYDGPVSFNDLSREISSVDLFVGARMHSCLNAVTLGKPTLFLAYSAKAHTMVHWLQTGPMAGLRDRLACRRADSVTLEDILDLITAQDRNMDAPDVNIDFMSTVVSSPIWDMLPEFDHK